MGIRCRNLGIMLIVKINAGFISCDATLVTIVELFAGRGGQVSQVFAVTYFL